MSQEIDSIMGTIQTQIQRSISSAINDGVLPETMNIIGSLPLDRKGTGMRTSSSCFGFGNAWKKPNAKITKKDSQSAHDLRENMDFSPYMSLFRSTDLFIFFTIAKSLFCGFLWNCVTFFYFFCESGCAY